MPSLVSSPIAGSNRWELARRHHPKNLSTPPLQDYSANLAPPLGDMSSWSAARISSAARPLVFNGEGVEGLWVRLMSRSATAQARARGGFVKGGWGEEVSYTRSALYRSFFPSLLQCISCLIFAVVGQATVRVLLTGSNRHEQYILESQPASRPPYG